MRQFSIIKKQKPQTFVWSFCLVVVNYCWCVSCPQIKKQKPIPCDGVKIFTLPSAGTKWLCLDDKRRSRCHISENHSLHKRDLQSCKHTQKHPLRDGVTRDLAQRFFCMLARFSVNNWFYTYTYCISGVFYRNVLWCFIVLLNFQLPIQFNIYFCLKFCNNSRYNVHSRKNENC